jgi:phage shock protein C
MAKKLVKGEKKLLGVCSGLANYFDIDPTIVRVGFVLGVIFAGTGILVYIILAIAMPDK